MTRKIACAVALLVALCLPGSTALNLSAQEGQEGWITLLDSTSLDGWAPTGDANWSIVDGAAEATTGNGHLVSAESYDNFELRAEFWVDDVANSGIFIRCSDPAMINQDTCYEVNIFDMRPDPTYGTGAIVGIAPVNPMPKAGGQWNTFEVRADGPQLTVVLNGMMTVDVMDTKFASGPITLQHGAGVVRFRKLEVRPL